jgi:hypothetical protein
MRILHITGLLLVCLGAFANQAWAEDLRIPVPGGGALVLPLPAGWRSSTQPDTFPTVSIAPASGGSTGGSFQVLVSALVAPDGRYAPATPEALRRSVEGAANAVKSQAVETSFPIQSFGSGKAQGLYFSATDKAPKPGEFKNMTQGSLSVSGLAVGFTILSNGNPQTAVEPALRMLSAARRE